MERTTSRTTRTTALAIVPLVVLAGIVAGTPSAAAAECKVILKLADEGIEAELTCKGDYCEAWVQKDPPGAGCNAADYPEP